MKKLTLLTILASNITFANTFVQTSQYNDTDIRKLSSKQIRGLIREVLMQDCQQRYPNARYQDCLCRTNSIVNEFKDRELKEIFLPESKWKYLTPSKLAKKVQKATYMTYICTQLEY